MSYFSEFLAQLIGREPRRSSPKETASRVQEIKGLSKYAHACFEFRLVSAFERGNETIERH